MLQTCLIYLFHLTVVTTGSIRSSNLARNLTLHDHLSLVDPDMSGAGKAPIANNNSLLTNQPVISFSEGTAKLPRTACLMVALETLVQLSFEDMSESYTHGIFMSDDFPEVLIEITSFESTGPHLSMPTSLVIICVMRLITEMMHLGNYRNSSVIPYWKRGRDFLPLGIVAFWAREGDTIQKPPRKTFLQKPGLTNFSTIDLRSNRTSAGTIDNDDDKLLVFAEFFGGPLTILDVFYNIYESIAYIAQFPTTDAMAPFEIRSAERPAIIQVDRSTRSTTKA